MVAIWQRDYDGVVSIVGRHITDITFIQDGRVVNVSITATGSGTPQRSVTLDFDVYRRSEVLE